MDWTSAKDTQLMKLIAAGKSASQIAPVLGTTRNSVIARANRVRGIVFQSDIDRRIREKEAAADRKKAVMLRRRAGAAKLRHCLGSGAKRDQAIVLAIQAGASMRQVGDILGITYQRVQQICSKAS